MTNTPINVPCIPCQNFVYSLHRVSQDFVPVAVSGTILYNVLFYIFCCDQLHSNSNSHLLFILGNVSYTQFHTFVTISFIVPPSYCIIQEAVPNIVLLVLL